DGGSGSFADLEKALQWVNTNASTYNIASVNLSLGDSQNWVTQTSRYGIGDELASIANQNVIISAAAGNSFYQFNSTQGLAYPAIDPNVVAVGAVWSGNFGSSKSFNGGAIDYTTSADQIASFSQRDDLFSEVFAPGILIKGANATGGTISMGGTSQAAPFLTGLATLAQEIAQDVLGRWLSVSEFRYLLDTTSNFIVDGDNENDNVINTGLTFPRINALKLAEGILSFNGITSDPNTGNSGSNSGGNSSTSPNAVSLVHTVNLVAGQVATGIDFGNQKLNQLPSITSSSTANFAENGTGIAYTVTASDPDAGTTLTSGLLNSDADASLFNINSTTGAITFKTAPDFETPLDSGADNTYNLTVTASDGSLTSSKAITITVTNLNEIQGNPLINNGRNPIVGTAGPDYLTGGAGAKTLTGGGGNDSFVFTNMRDVGQRIADFTVGEDKLVFTQLFSSLGYKGSNPIADGYIKFVQGTGANSAHTFLQIDRDGLTGSAIARNFLQVDNITPTQLNNINNFQF
ncbi:MAG: S8 family serine peptidase, partial [Snowella sp.]